ncbi:MAG: Gfo/Idh/MocA family oxidoreductase [Steroidobacteraceae bacterium]
MTEVRIGMLGASKIAPAVMIDPGLRTPGVALSIAARDRARAEAYAQKWKVPKVLDSYDAIIQSDVHAVYVPLHAGGHHEWAIKAAQAGKHVLVEKPFAMNTTEAQEMVDAGKKAGVLMIEAFHYYYHPLMQRVLELVRSGKFGTVEHVEATFIGPEFPVDQPDKWATYNDPKLGGSMLKHMGGYTLHFVRSIAGEPTGVKATGKLNALGSDILIDTDFNFAGGSTGRVLMDMTGKPRPFAVDGRVVFERGELIVHNFMVPHNDKPFAPVRTADGKYDYDGSSFAGWLEIKHPDGTTTRENFHPSDTTWWHQLQAFVNAVRNGKPLPTSGEDTINQMKLNDAIMRSAGFDHLLRA